MRELLILGPKSSLIRPCLNVNDIFLLGLIHSFIPIYTPTHWLIFQFAAYSYAVFYLKFRLESLHGPTVKKHLSRDYVGLIGFDERWKTVYSIWLCQVRFSGYSNFWFFDFGKLPSLNRMCYQRKFFTKISEI